MAISPRIKSVAERTIAGIQEFYRDYGEGAGSRDEMEHRIARVEAVMEGCNGLTQDEKIQKTAENVFELTCSQERSYDALRLEIKKSRDEFGAKIGGLSAELKDGLKEISDKIEESCSDTPPHIRPKKGSGILKVLIYSIASHPELAFLSFIITVVLVFISGHFELLAKLCGYK